jgi:hypothetical protein
MNMSRGSRIRRSVKSKVARQVTGEVASPPSVGTTREQQKEAKAAADALIHLSYPNPKVGRRGGKEMSAAPKVYGGEESKQGEMRKNDRAGDGGEEDEKKPAAKEKSPDKGGSEKKKGGAKKDEGHVKMKQTQPSHVKVKHTPRVPNDAPPNRKSIRGAARSAAVVAPSNFAGGSLKSPPEGLLAAKKKPAEKRKGSPKKTSSSAKSNKRSASDADEVLVSNLDGGEASPNRSKRKKKNGEEEMSPAPKVRGGKDMGHLCQLALSNSKVSLSPAFLKQLIQAKDEKIATLEAKVNPPTIIDLTQD